MSCFNCGRLYEQLENILENEIFQFTSSKHDYDTFMKKYGLDVDEEVHECIHTDLRALKYSIEQAKELLIQEYMEKDEQ